MLLLPFAGSTKNAGYHKRKGLIPFYGTFLERVEKVIELVTPRTAWGSSHCVDRPS